MAFLKQTLNLIQKRWQRRDDRRRIKGKLSKRQSLFALEPLEPRILLSVNVFPGGDIPNGQIWHAGDVQVINDDARVPVGATLTIEPGAIVKFKDWYVDLNVEGTLKANGKSDQPIVFTSYRDDTGGDTNGDGGASSPAAGNWGKIEFKAGSTASLDYAQIRYGGNGATGEVIVDSSNVTIAHSTISDTYTHGVRVVASNPALTGNTYARNNGAAISMDLASNPAVSGVTVSNNTINGLQVDSGTLVGNGFWNDPDIVYWIDSNVTVPVGQTLTVAPGQVIKFGWYGANLIVAGTLNADGTASDPIIFTDRHDDSAGPHGIPSDTNNNGSSAAGSEQWGAIQFQSGSTGNIMDYVDVRWGGYSRDGMVTLDHAGLSLTNSTLQHSSSDGVRIVASNPTLTNNTYSNNASAAASMDLASNPAISGVTAPSNAINGLQVDSGTLVGNGFWNDPDIVYWIDSNVTVPVGQTLTVAPGQVIKFGWYGANLIVAGTLNADGTASDPIIFTDRDDDTAGPHGAVADTNNNGSDTVGGADHWGTIVLQSTSTSNLMDYVDLRYGGYGQSGMLTTSAASLTVSNSWFRHSCSAGIRITDSSPTLTGNAFSDGAWAAITMNLASDPDVHGVALTNNGINGLQLDGGSLPADRRWDDPDIVYWLDGSVTVPAGKTLTIAAGQIVKFNRYWVDLTVAGTLNADGTASDPIIFTDRHDDSAGPHGMPSDTNNNGSSAAGSEQWGAIQFQSGSTGSVMDYVDIRWGGYNRDGMVTLDHAGLSLTNSTLQHSSSDGMRIVNANPLIADIAIQNNAWSAISMNMASNPAISDVTLTGNGTNGLWLDGGTISTDAFWDDPGVVYVLGNDVTVSTGATLTIGPGQIIKPNWWGVDLFVAGTLDAQGTATAPIIFTDRHDDDAGGDTNNNGVSTAGSERWGRIEFQGADANNLMDHVELRYGGNGSDGMIRVAGSSLTLTNSIVRNSSSYGVLVSGGTADLQSDLIVANSWAGVRAESKSVVDVVNNTIDGNQRGVDVDNSTARLTNNLITYNTWTGVRTAVWSKVSLAYNDVYNPNATNYDGVANPTGSKGNLSADPLYTDRAHFGYILQEGSPAIDAATSQGAPADDLLFNGRHDDPTVPNTGAGTPNYYDIGAIELGGLPLAVKHRPTGETTGAIDHVRFVFRGAMDTTSFSPADDIVSFQGPNGSVAVTGFNWVNPYFLDVTFAPQFTVGEYQMVLGPNILDASGVAMDTNVNGTAGEVPDDRYTATFSVTPPRIVNYAPRGVTGAPLSQFTVTFDRSMDTGSFAVINDLVSFAGPEGDIAPTGFQWLDDRTLQIQFDPLAVFGDYTWTLGPNILDVGGNALDNGRNGIAGETPGDQYTGAFTLAEILYVSGTISTDSTWNGNVVVTGGVAVPSGATLTIQPGTVVKFDPSTRIGIEVQSGGSLVANGTLAEPITFTSLLDDSVGGDANNDGNLTQPAAGDWVSIYANGGQVTLNHAQIFYGGGSTSGTWSESGMLRAKNGATMTVSNSILRDAFFDGVLAQTAGVTITNTIITGADRGVVAWIAPVSITNCTLDDNRIGVLAHGGTPTVRNSVITNSIRSGVEWDWGGAAPDVRYSDVWNPSGLGADYIGYPDQAGLNGNISVDPLYRNAATGSFQLHYRSPVIDAADGSLAPANDFMGAPRYDDPRTANTGTITVGGAFADMGAFEFVETAASDLDMVITSVTGPATGVAGDTVTVQWAGRNTGTGVATGSWHDAVYLSADAVWTTDDLLVGEFLHTGNLGANQSYTNSADVVLPGVLPGNYHFIVRANSSNEIFEGQNVANNRTASAATIAMDLRILTLGTPLQDSLPATGSSMHYKVSAPQGDDLRIDLDGPDGAVNELYVGYGSAPSRQSFDARGVRANQADQSVSIADTRGGNYYVMVYGANVSSPETFTLRASLAGFAIDSVSPAQGSNTGNVTITVKGAQFDDHSQPRLVDSVGGTLNPTQVYFTDSGMISATFDLTGHPTGLADIQVVNTGNVVTTLPDSFNVVAGASGRLATSVIVPDRVRVGRDFKIVVEYGNEGGTDILAPVMHLQNDGASPISLFPDMGDSSNAVELVGINPEMPAGVLPPGSRGRITVYAHATTAGADNFQLFIGQYPAVPFDWSAIGPLIRPENISDGDWNALFAQIQTDFGNSWNAFPGIVSRDATLLPSNTANNYCLKRILGIETQKAVAALHPSVEGRLFLTDTAHPLADVGILLDDSSAGEGYRAVSFSDGSFLFPSLQPGTYNVSFEGFLPATPLQLTIAQNDVNGAQWVVSPAGGISGSVVISSTGTPVQDLLVAAISQDGASFTARSDNNGQYSIGSLPAGVYEIRAGGGGYTQAAISGLNLSQGESHPHVNLTVAIAGTVQGTVTGPGGPVAGAQVGAIGADGTGFAAVTDATGAYVITGLAGQMYTVAARKEGLVDAQVSGVNLSAGQTLSGVNLSMLLGGSLAGQVVSATDGSPVPFAILNIHDSQQVFGGQSDANGNVSVTGLPPGAYSITTQDDNLMTTSANVTVVAGAAAPFTLSVAQRGVLTGTVTNSAAGAPIPNVPVYAATDQGFSATAVSDASGNYRIEGLDAGTYHVVLGQEDGPALAQAQVVFDLAHTTATANLSIAVAGFVAGTVFQTDGVTPIPGAAVGLSQAGNIILSTVTDQQGHYSFVIVAAGTYQIEAAADGRAFAPIAGVAVSGGANLTGRNLTAGNDQISGVVNDSATGRPIQDATVTILRADSGLGLIVAATLTTASDGSYSMTGAVPGPYRIMAGADGRATSAQNVIVTHGAVASATFNLAAGGSISGTVTETGSGLPLAGAALVLSSNDDPQIAEAVLTDASGRYDLRGFPPGNYSMLVSSANHEAVVIAALVLGADARNVNVNLSVASTQVKGVVSGAAGPLAGVVVSAKAQNGTEIEQAVTAATGAYTLRTLPSGTYSVSARAAGFNDSAPTQVTVTSGGTVTGVNLTLVATALPDPSGPLRGPLGSAMDWLNRLLNRPVKRSDHPTMQDILALPSIHARSCGPQITAALKGIEQADNAFANLEFVSSTVEGRIMRFLRAGGELATNMTVAAGAISRLILTFQKAGAAVAINEIIGLFDTARETYDAITGRAQVGDWLDGISLLDTLLAGTGAKTKMVIELTELGTELRRPGALAVLFKRMGQCTYLNVLGVVDAALDAWGGFMNSLEVWKQGLFNGGEQFNRAAATYDKAVDTAWQRINELKNCSLNPPVKPIGPAAPPTQQPPANVAPVSQPGPKGTTTKNQSGDPNDKVGPSGFGPGRYVQPGTMQYEIEFENAVSAGATVPAQEVFVTDTLDADLDLTTFEFVSFGFGNRVFNVPAGLKHYETTIDLRPEGIQLLVPVVFDLNTDTQEVAATFRSLDPLTGMPPDNVDAGFLPVNNASHVGEGFITYLVRPKSGIASGTVMDNQASIVFDINAAILTPTTHNTLDVGDPTSTVAALPARVTSANFPVSWSGSDDTAGSGIAAFDIFVSDNGGLFTSFLSDTTQTSAIFSGQNGHTYRFFSVATDNVGLREADPVTADTTTTVNLTEGLTIGTGANKAFIYTDTDGTTTTVTIKGGTATVFFSGDNIQEQFSTKGVTVTGQNLEIVEIALADTTTSSSLTFTTKGGDGFSSVGKISGDDPLGKLTGKGIDLTGEGVVMTGDGYINTIDIHGTQNGADLILPGTQSASGITVKAGTLGTGTNIELGSGLKSLTATQWDGGALIAPWAFKITISSDFGADLILSGSISVAQTLGALTVKGNIQGGDWDIWGNVGKISVTGAMDNVEMRATGNVTSLTTAALRHSTIFAGVRDEVEELPASLNDFEVVAEIKTLTIKGISGSTEPSFVDSRVGARSLGKVSLKAVKTDNEDIPFGFAADKITSYTRTGVKLSKLDIPGEPDKDDDYIVRVL